MWKRLSRLGLSVRKFEKPIPLFHTRPTNNAKGGRRYRLYADNSTPRKDQKEMRKRAASYAHEDAGRENSRVYIFVMGEHRVQKATTGSWCRSHRSRGPEITKVPVVRNVSNEGTAITKTVWYQIVRMVDLQGNGESGGDVMLCLMAMCGVYLTLHEMYM
jgi:hypothetical protein